MNRNVGFILAEWLAVLAVAFAKPLAKPLAGESEEARPEAALEMERV